MTEQAKGESAKAFQLQLKPHLKENIAKKVIIKEEQNDSVKDPKCHTVNSNAQNPSTSALAAAAPSIPEASTNSQFNPLDVIKSLAEMKPIVIIKKDTPPQSKSRRNSYSNQRAISNRLQGTNGFQGDSNGVPKSEQILEEDAQEMIEKHSQIGFQSLQRDDLKSALLNLRRADIIMNAFIASEGSIDMSILYFVKINLGICFYKIGLLDEAFTCFETCIMSIKKQKRNPNVNLILVKLYFQCCILQSELSNHERALIFGKKATKTVITQYMDQLIILTQKLVNYQRSLQAMDAIQSQNQLSISRNPFGKKNDKNILENDYYGTQFIKQNKRVSAKSAINTSIDQQQNSFYNISNLNLNGQSISELDLQADSIQALSSNQLENEPLGIQRSDKNNNVIMKGNKLNNKRKLLEIQTSAQNESFYMSSQLNDTQSEISKDVKGLLQQNASETQTIVSDFDTNLKKIEIIPDITDHEKNLFMILKSILSKVLDMPSLLSAKKYSVLQGLFKNQLCSTIEAIQSPLLEKNKKTQSDSPQKSYGKEQQQYYRSTFNDKFNLKEMFKNQETVLQKSNILGQLQLKPMSLESIRVALPNEVSEKILLFTAQLSVGYYCISTEYRFIEQPQVNTTKDNCDEITHSENYLSRALEIAFVYMPHEVPLVGQIMSVHTKFHAAFRQCIYEDQPDQKNHTLVRTLQGGCKAPYFIPLIRKKAEQFQLNNSKILNTDLIKQHQDFSKQERLHLDAHPTEEYQNETESDQGFFISDDTPNGQNHLLQQNLTTIIHKGNDQQKNIKQKQKRPSISREKSAEGTSRKNRKSNEQIDKIYKNNRQNNNELLQNNQQPQQTNEFRARQNRTLDPPSKARSNNSNNGSITIHSSFINTPQSSTPQSTNQNHILNFQVNNNRQQKSTERPILLDSNNSFRSIDNSNTTSSSTVSSKNSNNYLNRLKIITKPPLHQRIQQMIHSQQQQQNGNHGINPSLHASQIQLNSHEKQIEKEIFQLQMKQQQQHQSLKTSQVTQNNFISQADETVKYKIQNNQQGHNQSQYATSQQSFASANTSSSQLNQNQSSNGSQSANLTNMINSASSSSSAPPTNPMQKKKRNFNIQINNNINFFIQNGSNSNNSSLNNSFHNTNQLPESSNENVPSKSFNNTPLASNRQQYSRSNNHTNKSQNSNQNTTNPNISALIQDNIIFNQDRSNSLNYPNTKSKRSKHVNKTINTSSIHYTSAHHSPNTSIQIMNTSTPQNSTILFPLSVKNKNAHQGQQQFNTTLHNSPNTIIPQQIPSSSLPQSAKNKQPPQLRDIIMTTGNQTVKNQAIPQEIPIQFGLPSSAKNTYINNRNLRKFKLASELINF